LICCFYDNLYASLTRLRHSLTSFAIMSSESTVAPESVSVTVPSHLERPVSEEEYWPLTLDAVRDCDLSYLNDKWSEDMIRDGMRSIIRVCQLPEVRDKEISVWTYLSKYSPPSDRGFMFSYGDDRIVTLVGDNMETGHSGASMGWTMRNIEFIAKNGLPAHRARFLNSRQNN
jgi:hypothetical protein